MADTSHLHTPEARAARAATRAARGPRPSMRKAIDAMCKGCIYDPEMPGTWRAQTEGCQITTCPLHPLRPRTSASPRGDLR